MFLHFQTRRFKINKDALFLMDDLVIFGHASMGGHHF
jgi:hypothetical protein